MSQIHIPAFIHFACQQCGRCCKGWPVPLSERDYERLGKYNWVKVFPQLDGVPLFREVAGHGGQKGYQTALRPSGACVFLDERNRCLIHRHLGGQAKPIGCQVFPLRCADTPAGVFVGCRFTCPAIVQGQGPALTEARAEVTRLASALSRHGAGAEGDTSVRFNAAHRLAWADVLSVESKLCGILRDESQGLSQRLALCCLLMDELDKAKLDRIPGEKLKEFLDLMAEALREPAASLVAEPPKVRRAERWLFSQLLGHFYVQADPRFRELPFGERLRTRLRLFWQRMGILWQTGEIRQEGFIRPVRVKEAWGAPRGSLSPDSAKLLETYLCAKLFGKSTFGERFFGYSYVEGFHFLVATYAAILWFSRAWALGHGAKGVGHGDVAEAVQLVDRSYGYLEAFGMKAERLRTFCLGHENMALRIALRMSAPPG